MNKAAIIYKAANELSQITAEREFPKAYRERVIKVLEDLLRLYLSETLQIEGRSISKRR